jgi:ABC-type Fe3+-hydroxamate transport system substrate-binding protein
MLYNKLRPMATAGRSLIAVVDDRGRRIELAREPERVVSLVPSDSYTLARLGAAARLVGRTEYCVEPAELAAVEVVGGTKSAAVRRIVELTPDLVVCNQEENRRVDVERLDAAGLAVLVSFPRTVADGLAHAERLAALFPSLAGGHEDRLAAARARLEHHARRRVAPVPAFVPIWMQPLMTANAETFLGDVVELAGGHNVFADRPRRYPLAADLGRAPPLPPEAARGRDLRYPRITEAEIVERAPSIVLLPDEPHAFGEADADVFRALPIPAARSGHIHFCSGRDLMWYGLRALEGIDRIAALFDAARGRGADDRAS